MTTKVVDDDTVSSLQFVPTPSLLELHHTYSPTLMTVQTRNLMPLLQRNKLTSFQFQEIRRAVRDHSSNENISDPQSPQSRALTGMSDSDKSQLKPNNREAVVQRYVLAVYFHVTEGDG